MKCKLQRQGKRLLRMASAAIGLAVLCASNAGAQTVTGTVTVSGFVAPRCGATYAGNSSFSGTIELGELSAPNGALSPAFTGSTSSNPAASTIFLVGCNQGASEVTVSATRLSNPSLVGDPSASDDIDFTAEAKIALSAGGFAFVNYTTAATLPAPTTALVSGTFANTASGNFEVRVYGFAAEMGAASILVAGTYTSTISITVTPAS